MKNLHEIGNLKLWKLPESQGYSKRNQVGNVQPSHPWFTPDKLDDFRVPAGVASRYEQEGAELFSLSIAEMLSWKPSPLIRHIYHLEDGPIAINPTPHARSKVGSLDERRAIFDDITSFLESPDTADYIANTFTLPGKTFRGRPPLQVVPYGTTGVVGDANRYNREIFISPQSSLYFILGTENGPVASIGFNQYDDGVEVRCVQGVRSDKVGGESVEVLSRLENWSEKLVGLVERYADAQGLRYRMVLPASENMWVNYNKFTFDRAKRLYDDMAIRRGYAYNQKLKRFIKDTRNGSSDK